MIEARVTVEGGTLQELMLAADARAVQLLDGSPQYAYSVSLSELRAQGQSRWVATAVLQLQELDEPADSADVPPA